MKQIKNLWRYILEGFKRKVLLPIDSWATPGRLIGVVVLRLGIGGICANYQVTHPEGFRLVAFLADCYVNASVELTGIALTVLSTSK